MESTDKDRLEAVLKHLGLNARELSQQIGLKSPQTFYDIQKGKHGISKGLAASIQAKYLNISSDWLLTGNGEMLIESKINANNIGVEIHRLLKIIEEQNHTIAILAEQIAKQ